MGQLVHHPFEREVKLMATRTALAIRNELATNEIKRCLDNINEALGITPEVTPAVGPNVDYKRTVALENIASNLTLIAGQIPTETASDGQESLDQTIDSTSSQKKTRRNK